MNDKNETFNLLAHQIEHETTLSKLYKVYSVKFPNESIWKDLEVAEKKHASLIQQLINKVSDDIICLKKDPNICGNIKLSIERMTNEIDKVEDAEVDLLYAFKTGFEIEESMIEREFFKSLDTDAPIVEDILSKIVKDTEKHRESLIEAKNKYLDKLAREPHNKVDIEEIQVKPNENSIPNEEISLNRDLDNTNN